MRVFDVVLILLFVMFWKEIDSATRSGRNFHPQVPQQPTEEAFQASTSRGTGGTTQTTRQRGHLSEERAPREYSTNRPRTRSQTLREGASQLSDQQFSPHPSTISGNEGTVQTTRPRNRGQPSEEAEIQREYIQNRPRTRSQTLRGGTSHTSAPQPTQIEIDNPQENQQENVEHDQVRQTVPGELNINLTEPRQQNVGHGHGRPSGSGRKTKSKKKNATPRLISGKY
uniref:Uncharacterized protein n=1 Tax=Meloidogyne javanica TaxID=6303 RepID=A0A915LXA5_MELJA